MHGVQDFLLLALPSGFRARPTLLTLEPRFRLEVGALCSVAREHTKPCGECTTLLGCQLPHTTATPALRNAICPAKVQKLV